MLEIPIQDRFRETRIFGLRLMVMVVFIALTMLTLVGRLIYLQAINHEQFVSRSQANRLTPLPIPPVRGLILDRNGVVLAQNYPVLTLDITPEQVDDMGALLKRLGTLVQLSDYDLKQFNKQRK
jgi:penicillin-binding protein 2